MGVVSTGPAQPWVDVALVGGLGALAVVQLVSDPPARPALTAALTAVSVAVLLLRRTAPILCAAGELAALVPLGLLGGGTPPFATFLAAIVAVYSQARYASGRRLLAGLALLVGAVVGVSLAEMTRGSEPFEIVYPLVYFGGATAVGFGVRRLADMTRRLSEQAAELERSRDREARLAVASERTRIARDLHDVVAHGVSLMVVQTEAALGVLRSQPEVAEEALAHAQRAGREAIAELQQLVRVLREDDDAALSAQGPGLHQLEVLVEDARRCGISVALENDAGTPLPRSVDVTAYRVVQEALTNVVRHSGASSAVVRLLASDGRLVVEVVDDGRGTRGAAEPRGHGLVGLRERVGLAGGELEVGDAGDQPGFRVRAVLPLESA